MSNVSYDLMPVNDALWYVGSQLDALEHARIAINNQIKQLERDAGLVGSLAYLELLRLRDSLALRDKEFTKELEKQVRRHSLHPFVKRTVGLGAKQAARFLQVVPDPAWNAAESRPRRGPAELWAYCGYKPGQKRQRGEKSNWNPVAKMRLRLMAESCIKQAHSPYRAVYDRERAKWAERDTSDLHKHTHALRVVAKEIAKDLFLEARRVSAIDQPIHADHDGVVGGTSSQAEAA
jgi:hypothetical protein